ncbi:bifunctional 3'-5' exonuclease/DNA polymerase [Cellulomonas persica]|uniref:bifunctional 3'-5' exonuclease/DNA polymerase n=1 Tax=Cellulomonas persica TaxID=76861 RepID=UPI0024826F09|nr:bifunctional 3'-5' exonuclease/DNA polymerase [Cellulomonas persica]
MIVVVARPGAQAPDRRAVAAVVAPDAPGGDAVLGTERAVRWAWADTNAWYPRLLADGVRVERCLDLRLTHRLLRSSATTSSSLLATAASGPFDEPAAAPDEATTHAPTTLFDAVDDVADDAAATPGSPAPIGASGLAGTPDLDACLAELDAQDGAVRGSTAPGRLRLLVAGESAGALAAAEMRHAGLPWDAHVHDEVLRAHLGARPARGTRPPEMERLAARIRAELDAPSLNPDSLPDVLRALRRVGLPVSSTRKWELANLDHPAIAPLLEYKTLSRLHSANGWAWLDEWVRDGRFRPEYVVGGVVTGRWGSSGGGALQIPRLLRTAVRADPGWRLVVADAAQLEPRVLAGMAHDERMAAAGAGRDLYAGIVEAGVVPERALAKVGMLGALYGGTTGASASVLPRLLQAFPRATGLVEEAARAGERGEVVTTLLGRSSPPPDASWLQAQAAALDPDATDGAQSQARARTRAWGRFTRNFVVQGTAAEWALCWIAELRRRLWAMGAEQDAPGAVRAPFVGRPHLVYFLHDELVVHCPAGLADDVADAVVDAAASAGRLLFGGFPVEFPLSVGVAQAYDQAKDAAALRRDPRR